MNNLFFNHAPDEKFCYFQKLLSAIIRLKDFHALDSFTFDDTIARKKLGKTKHFVAASKYYEMFKHEGYNTHIYIQGDI